VRSYSFAGKNDHFWNDVGKIGRNFLHFMMLNCFPELELQQINHFTKLERINVICVLYVLNKN
jgi:hypothetical protein